MLIKRILELCTDTNANETTKYKDILRYHETHAMRWQTFVILSIFEIPSLRVLLPCVVVMVR